MKVLHIIPTLGMGGAEKLLVDSLKFYQQHGICCEVAVLSNYENVYESKITELDIPLYVSDVASVYHLKNVVFLKKLLKNQQYDVIHCHLYAAQLFTPLACFMKKNKPVLITTEHSTSNRRRQIALFKPIDYWMYKHYRKVICISDGTKLELEYYLPRLSSKMTVIENGIIPAVYRKAKPVEWAEVLPNYNGEIIVLMVASLRHQKDPITLIEAAKQLGTNFRIVFVGNGEKMVEAVEYATQFDIKNVDFLGERQDIPQLMKAASVFVLSSHWEGFGLVVVEAAAAGIPIVASNIPGLREVVLNVNGQLFEQQHVVDLVQKIKVAHQFPSYFDEKYSIEQMVTQYVDEIATLTKFK